MPVWEVRYKTPRKFGQLQFWHPNEPSREVAAQRVWDELFPERFVIQDPPSGIEHVTVWQLQQEGVHINNLVQLVAPE